MEHVTAILNLGITGYYIYTITRHMVRPGNDIAFTRMLMFAGLGIIPVAFLSLMVAGRAEIIGKFGLPGAWSDFAFYDWFLAAGLALLALLPFALLAGLWFMMGLRMGFYFFLFLVPLLSRLIFMSERDLGISAVVQIMLFFACIFITLGIVCMLNRYFSGTGVYEKHIHKIWPGYRTAANMFFWVCTFALTTQLIEFIRALTTLIRFA